MNFIKKAQIKTQSETQNKAKIEALVFDKTFIIILAKYFDYNIFSAENIAKFPKYTKINNYIIELKKGKQLFFRLIYNLSLIKLEILKIYIKTNLTNDFIQSYKSFTKILILFN